jgi:hypothetical protein
MQLVGDLDPQLIVDHQFFLFCGGLKPVYSDARRLANASLSANRTEFILNSDS